MKKEYLYAGLSIFLWSTTATVTKLLLGSLNSMQVLTVSCFFAFAFLFLLNVVKKNLGGLKQYTVKDFLEIFGIGILGTFFYNLFFYMGVDYLLASQAFIINYLWPMMIVVFACILLKEKMTIKKMIAIIISFVGVVIVTTNGKLSGLEQENLLGALYCILAAVSYGLFSVLNKLKGYDQYLSMMLYYFVAFVVSFVYTIVTKDWFTLSFIEITGLMWMGIFVFAIAFTSWAFALDKGDTAKISNLAYITPFLSLIGTFVFLKEPFSIYSILGLVIIILGIGIQMKD